MPPGLLMPAFVLVLVANALLIALAMRSLMPARDSSDPPIPVPRTAATPAAPVAAGDQPPAEPDVSGSAPDPEAATEPLPEAAAATTGTTTATVKVTAPKARKPAAKSATRAAAVATATRAATRTTNPPAAGAAGAAAKATRRRRFSLPPLDDDQEKVNRSIESFLASGEPAPEADAAPTTVAFVALAPSIEDGPTDPAVAEMLERELLAAARGTDRVERVAPERWQVTLAATGELAARAYLRAVRAAMEPALVERHPLRLVAATVLDESVAEATATAERRLAAALAASSSGSTAATSEPRAAGD